MLARAVKPKLAKRTGLFALSSLRSTEYGTTISGAYCVAPAYVAETFTDVDDVTVRLVAVNVALVAPVVTLTLAGTVTTDVFVLVSITVVPLGAPPFKVTVPVEMVPP
jgi:hypothetical protein